MRNRGLAAATINRRLSTVRRLVKLARRLGLIDWAIDVEGMKAQPYRDTTGPGSDGWRKLLAAAKAAGDGPKARRDRAILRLLHDNAMRRGEVVAMDVEDLDLEGTRVAIVGKGQTERALADPQRADGGGAARLAGGEGGEAGPLFINFHPAQRVLA